MDFRELITIALGALQTNRLRTFLTALGIIIGTASVIVMLAIGNGAKASIEDRVSSLGANILTISPGNSQTGVVNAGVGSAQTLTIDDYQFLRSELANNVLASGLSTEAASSQQLASPASNTNTQVYGVASSYFDIRSHTLNAGALFSDIQDNAASKVVVIGSGIAKELFPNNSPLGQNLRIGSHIFTVIGVLNSKGQSGFLNTDNFVYVPFNTFNRYLNGANTLRTVIVRAANSDNISALQLALTGLMLRKHGISDPAAADFRISSSQSTLETLNAITSTFTILLAGIASISLFVGGIGIMNTMIITITERTREIGLRKAVGAKESSILYQFVIESIVLSVAAACIGIVFGILMALGIGSLNITPVRIGLDSILISTFVSVVIGLIFGIFPARRASKLSPIDALRFE